VSLIYTENIPPWLLEQDLVIDVKVVQAICYIFIFYLLKMSHHYYDGSSFNYLILVGIYYE